MVRFCLCIISVCLLINHNLQAQKYFDENCIPNESIKIQHYLPNFQEGALGFKKLFSLLANDTLKIQKALNNNTLSVSWEIINNERCAQNITVEGSDTSLQNEINSIIAQMPFWEARYSELDSADSQRKISCRDTIWDVYFTPPSKKYKIQLKSDLTYQVCDTSSYTITNLYSCFSSSEYKIFQIVPAMPTRWYSSEIIPKIFDKKNMKRFLKKATYLTQNGELSLALTVLAREVPQFKAKCKTKRAIRLVKRIEKTFFKEINALKYVDSSLDYSCEDLIYFLGEDLRFLGRNTSCRMRIRR